MAVVLFGIQNKPVLALCACSASITIAHVSLLVVMGTSASRPAASRYFSLQRCVKLCVLAIIDFALLTWQAAGPAASLQGTAAHEALAGSARLCQAFYMHGVTAPSAR